MPRDAHCIRYSPQLGAQIRVLATGDRAVNAAIVALLILGLDAVGLSVQDMRGDARQALAKELHPQLHQALAALVFDRPAAPRPPRGRDDSVTLHAGSADAAAMHRPRSADEPSMYLARTRDEPCVTRDLTINDAAPPPTDAAALPRRALGTVGIEL